MINMTKYEIWKPCYFPKFVEREKERGFSVPLSLEETHRNIISFSLIKILNKK